MRWEHLQLDVGDGAAPVLPLSGAVTRTFDTPHFRDMTFYEVRAKSIVNRVPDSSRMPFRWTVNPYRGCSHACVYCFARGTHTYLGLDAGRDFDTKVVVKVNAAEVLRRELAAPRWRREHIAMGTNVDCYQRAEGRYELMRGILAALRDAANPFSILTKGTLVLRDLDLLREAAAVTDVTANVSVGFLDEDLWRLVEPGTPSPRRRLEVCRKINEAGIRCGVLMAPVLPYLSDSPAQLDATVRAVAAAGAVHVSPVLLHLRPGAREVFLGWLAAHHPSLVPRYAELYAGGAYASRARQQQLSARVRELWRRHSVGGTGGLPGPGGPRRVARTGADPPGGCLQPALL